MGIVSTVLCKTAGAAGISAALYDAYSHAKLESKRTSQNMTADYFEHIHAAKRTSTRENHVNTALQNKVADLRMNNPIVPFAGRVGGFVKGALHSLGNNILPVSFAALALGAKGFFAKLGAFGTAGTLIYTLLKEGFGIGKSTPID